MNIYKDVFTYNKKDLKKLNSEEIIKIIVLDVK